MPRLTKLYTHLIALSSPYPSHPSSLSFSLSLSKPKLVLMTFRVTGKQFISFLFFKKGNANITRSLSKMPLGKLHLWLYSLSFSTFLFFPFLHVKLSGRLWSQRHASSPFLPLTELPPATGRQFHRNPWILSSLTSVPVLCPLEQGGSPPPRKRDTTRKKIVHACQWVPKT